MKLTPLVMLAAMRVPALTDIFSDTLAVSSMAVDAGGLVTINCSAPHGFAINSQRGICVVDAQVPNPIVDLSEFDNGDVLVETEFPHELTTTPDATEYEAWDGFAVISGTGVVGLDGNRQLVSVDTPTTFRVRPSTDVTLPGSIPGAAKHLARLEVGLPGWHVATATTTTQLTFPCPASVTRDFTVTSPKIVTNIRVWGAVDLEHALSLFVRDDDNETPVPGQGYLFITPLPQARLSRDFNARSDATTEIQPGAAVRQRLLDGFEVYAVLPSERSGGAVACMDKAHGSILRAMMRTFNGLRLPYTEFALPDPFVTMMTSHGMARFTRANYCHQYAFEATVQITNADCAPPNLMPDMEAVDWAVTDGTPVPTVVQPEGTVPWTGGMTFGPDPEYGIWQHDKPQPLTANITLPPEE